MSKEQIRKWIMLWLLASLTTLALAMDLSVVPVTQVDGATADNKIYYQLLALKKSIAWSHPALCLAAAALMKLYSKAFAGMRFKMSEWLLAAFFSAAMVVSSAVQLQQSVRILWASALQPLKAAICWGGLLVMWLAVIRAAQQALAWLQRQKPACLRHPMRTPLLIILAAWLPMIIVRFPGAMMDDTMAQITEFYGAMDQPSTNPAAHTILIGSLMKVGEWLGSPMVGLYLNLLLQVLALALCFAWFACLLQQMDAPAPVVWMAVLLPVISPLFVSYATFVLKDSLCATAVLLFMVETGVLAARPDVFCARRRHMVMWCIGMTAAILTRTNGVLFVLPTAVAALLSMLGRQSGFTRRSFLAALGALAIMLALAFGLQAAANERMNYGSGNIREVLSIPFQQTARVLRENDVPAEEIAVIDRVLDAQIIVQVYEYYYADVVKNTYRNGQATTQDLLEYFSVWARHLARYPVSSFDALACMCHRVFSPSTLDVDLTLAGRPGVIGPGWDTSLWWERMPLLEADKLISGMQHMVAALPFVGLLLSLGAHTCCMLISGMFMLRTRRRLWILWITPVMSVIMLVLTPITLTRYALPLFFSLPVALCCLCTPKTHTGGNP